MKEIVILVDEEKGEVRVSASDDSDPWEDIAILIEAIGMLASLCRRGGKKTHDGKPISKHFHKYLDKVLRDYENSWIETPPRMQ